jgi:predicted dehydrogenase
MSATTTLGVVGTGWRAEFFVRLAGLLPERLTLVGAATRRPETAEQVARRWGVPCYLSPTDLVSHQHPDFVISSVPWAANPGVIGALVASGTPVLTETPPAPDRDALRALWSQVGDRDLVQVAEQYPALPGHVARAELLRSGAIGSPTSVQVSSTHGYHAVALIRGFLGVGFEPVTVRSTRFTAPLVDPLTRGSWTGDDTPKDAGTTLATIDFGDGRSGLYDFTDNQWHNQLRFRRIIIRGSRGEIADDNVVRLTGPETILRSSLVRSQLGYDLNLDGFDTEHFSFDGRVVYRNPFLGLRLMDDEIAIATLMLATARWAGGDGPAPYPLAQGCQDQLISLAIDAATVAGVPVTVDREAWAR